MTCHTASPNSLESAAKCCGSRWPETRSRSPLLRGDALTTGALGQYSTRTGQALETYLASLNLDADGDRQAWAMTDGLLILRAMLDLTGTALAQGDRCVSSQRAQRAGNPDMDCIDASGGLFALSDTSYIDPARAKLRTAKRRTNASLIYRRTKNLRAVQILLGHTKTEGTLRYLGIDVDDALETADQTVV